MIVIEIKKGKFDMSYKDNKRVTEYTDHSIAAYYLVHRSLYERSLIYAPAGLNVNCLTDDDASRRSANIDCNKVSNASFGTAAAPTERVEEEMEII